MFTTSEQFSRAARDLFDTQAAFYAGTIHAFMDAGMTATELNVDAMKTLLASATVATRQWLTASGNSNWSTPVSRQALVQLRLDVQPAGAAPAAVPDPGTVARWSA